MEFKQRVMIMYKFIRFRGLKLTTILTEPKEMHIKALRPNLT
jgi:hypothetical protein